MMKPKKRRGATSAKAATPNEAPQTASKAKPENAISPPLEEGAGIAAIPAPPDEAPVGDGVSSYHQDSSEDSPHLTRAGVYQHGFKALRELEEDAKKGRTYRKWFSICEALDEARKEALDELGATHSNLPTHRLGGGYNKVLGAILNREHLNSKIIDAKTRSDAFNVIKHRVEIRKWREGLDPVKRARLNHPTSIWRAFKETLPKKPKKPKKSKNRMMPAEPKIESWAQPSGSKPSEQQIERVAEKQAREAEHEAAALEHAPIEREVVVKVINALINGEMDLNSLPRMELLRLAVLIKQQLIDQQVKVN
jgi:hypothetical protein